MERKMKEIYNVSTQATNNAKTDGTMEQWHNDLINKTYNQLDLFDVSRMLIQKVFLDTAISKAVSLVHENPFCGQRYEGELLELLFRLEPVHFVSYKDSLGRVLEAAMLQNKTYEWLCEEERGEFFELLSSFQKKLEKC